MAARVGRCALPGCHRPVHVDPVTNVEHDYCGRTHAKQALGDGLADGDELGGTIEGESLGSKIYT